LARRLRWTRTAVDDLEEIAAFIAEDAPGAAARLVRRIRDAVRSLSDLAERGRRVAELPAIDVRELIVGSYRLVYRIEPEAVVVLTIVHGARDLAALWERRLGDGS
jgi:addiction module RelE/StbE family toxin